MGRRGCDPEHQLTGAVGPWEHRPALCFLAEKDEFDIPNLTDNSRRQLFRTKSKRRFFFRVSEELLQQQRRCACSLGGRGLLLWGRGEPKPRLPGEALPLPLTSLPPPP